MGWEAEPYKPQKAMSDHGNNADQDRRNQRGLAADKTRLKHVEGWQDHACHRKDRESRGSTCFVSSKGRPSKYRQLVST